jgi:hypothetical protein
MNLIVGVREEEWEMKKGIVAVVLGLILLFGVACGKDADEGATTLPAEGASGSSASAGSGDAADEDAPAEENEEGYLDETTGIFHSVYGGISFSLPEGWLVMDGLHDDGGVSLIYPPETDENNPGVAIQLANYSDSAQMAYDGYNESGSLGESQEVVYGSNTYISNVEPAGEDGSVYYFYSGKSDPVVYLWTNIAVVDKAALEEILTSFSY